MNARSNSRIVLCLACSSSIRFKQDAPHVTRCCGQVICGHCLQANPRLASYDPCLACLGGVGAARASSNVKNKVDKSVRNDFSPNPTIPDGVGMFVLGDDSDEETEEQGAVARKVQDPPPSTGQEAMDPSADSIIPEPQSSSPLLDITSPTQVSGTPRKYYINPSDSVHGIALRFGVDARELCQRNKLPPSTLNTTPHLLHTRTVLELPPISRPVPLQHVLTDEDRTMRDAHRARERAEKRLQMATKEVDWQVAKTYVALASDPDIADDLTSKRKEDSTRQFAGPSGERLETIAVNMYLEDEEWEQRERRANRFRQQAAVTKFPENSTTAQWWPWKSW